MNILATPWYIEFMFKAWGLMMFLLYLVTHLVDNRKEREYKERVCGR